MVNKGILITLEGIDGTGKGTQADLLIQKFQELKIDYIFTREPGATPISEAIRKILLDTKNSLMHPWTEAFLYLAARTQNTFENIHTALESGTIILCDRYADSTVAYQGSGRGLSRELLKQLNRIATFEREPDLTLLFHLDHLEAQNRLGDEDKFDRLEAENIRFHQKVKDGFLLLAKEHPERVCIIDASQKPEQVFKQVWNKVEPFVVKYICK